MKRYRDSPVSLMYRSGAKGGLSQIGQLGGMRGLLQSLGETALPNIVHHFREGVTPLEFCAGSNAGRKTMCDKKLCTAPAGAFTRNMVEAAYRVIVTAAGCKERIGVRIKDYARIESIMGFLKGDKGFKIAGCMERERRQDGRVKIGSDRYHSVLTCKATPPGVCARCYGKDLSTMKPPPVGTPVGVIAAQSVGERGTQLSMRTFHTGGAKGENPVEGFSRMERLLNDRPIAVPVFDVESPGDTDIGMYLQHGFHRGPLRVDGWTLFLHCMHSSAREGTFEPPTISSEAGETPRDYISLRLSDLLHPEFIRDVFLMEGHLIYGGAIHERHFEVILRAVQEVDEYGGLHGDRYPPLSGNPTALLNTLSAMNMRTVIPEGLLGSLSQEERRLLEGRYPPVLKGLERSALEQPSFLAAASYRRSLTVLARAALEEKEDPLEGMKERVMIGSPGRKERS